MRISPPSSKNGPTREGALLSAENVQISSVVVPCSARKCSSSSTKLDGRGLPRGTQARLSRLWSDALRADDAPQFRADALYQGGGFRRAKVAAESLNCPLYVVSAGLGLLRSTTEVPPYELSLSPGVTSSLLTRIVGPFDPVAWWSGLMAGPYATSTGELSQGTGRVLVAVTRPYAGLFTAAFASLPEATVARIRIFGPGIKTALPGHLQAQVIEHRRELDAVMPGLCLDAGVRGMAHFASLSDLEASGNVQTDQEAFDRSLRRYSAPTVVRRPKLSDRDLKKHISEMVSGGLSSTAALKHLRTALGVACEANRFRRMYVEVST